MYCSNCGKDISDAAKFCPLCGSPQSASQQTKSESESVVIDGENAEVFNFHEWIVQNGLESYEELLKTQDLNTLDVLMTLTESDLEKIGIESIGAKKKITNGIQKLKTSASTFSATQEISEKESIPNRCPNCGNILKENAKFCPECGTKVVKSCSSCGAPLEDGAKFCSQCGEKVEA